MPVQGWQHVLLWAAWTGWICLLSRCPPCCPGVVWGCPEERRHGHVLCCHAELGHSQADELRGGVQWPNQQGTLSPRAAISLPLLPRLIAWCPHRVQGARGAHCAGCSAGGGLLLHLLAGGGLPSGAGWAGGVGQRGSRAETFMILRRLYCIDIV